MKLAQDHVRFDDHALTISYQRAVNIIQNLLGPVSA